VHRQHGTIRQWCISPQAALGKHMATSLLYTGTRLLAKLPVGQECTVCAERSSTDCQLHCPSSTHHECDRSTVTCSCRLRCCLKVTQELQTASSIQIMSSSVTRLTEMDPVDSFVLQSYFTGPSTAMQLGLLRHGCTIQPCNTSQRSFPMIWCFSTYQRHQGGA
jgi:hypothetical protein